MASKAAVSLMPIANMEPFEVRATGRRCKTGLIQLFLLPDAFFDAPVFLPGLFLEPVPIMVFLAAGFLGSPFVLSFWTDVFFTGAFFADTSLREDVLVRQVFLAAAFFAGAFLLEPCGGA